MEEIYGLIAEYGALVVIAGTFIIMSVAKDRWIMNRLSQDIEGQGDSLEDVLEWMRKTATIMDAMCNEMADLKIRILAQEKGGKDDEDRPS